MEAWDLATQAHAYQTTAALLAGLTISAPVFAGIEDWYPEREEIVSLTIAKHRPAEAKKGAHRRLQQAMEARGLTIELNAAICQEPLPEELRGYRRSTWASIYYSQERRVVICQEDYRAGVNESPEWTAKDYAALRREAQHLLQDCNAGELFDGEMAPTSVNNGINPALRTLLDSPGKAVLGWLGSYGRKIGPKEHLSLQYEAYGVASYNKPGKLRKQIERSCS